MLHAVQVLETPRDVEYGAPSMHTSLALVMNLAVAQLAAPLLSGPMPRPGAGGTLALCLRSHGQCQMSALRWPALALKVLVL